MEPHNFDIPLAILLTGILVVLTMLVKPTFERVKLPPLVGYLAIGVLLSAVNRHWPLFSSGGKEMLSFLATLGLVTLLFRVGLESNLDGLLRQLPKASLIWVGDILISSAAGYAAAIFLLGLPWPTAAIIAVAMSATSVGISVGVWQSRKALDTPEGEFLLDVAELDDISAVLLMALLFALLPEIHDGGGHMGKLALQSGGLFLAKLLLFGLACLLFSRYLEKPLTRFFTRREAPPDPMLAVIGIGLIFAALAGLLGFSVAIGAFLVGLVFSRDPEAVKMEASFQPVYELFSPFFFIGIGFDIDLASLGGAVAPGLVLLAVAILGKLAADGLPVFFLQGKTAAALIGVSMVPRAEIAMVIMSRGRDLGAWAVPASVYSAMVLVSAATCVLAPLAVGHLLEKWPPQNQD